MHPRAFARSLALAALPGALLGALATPWAAAPASAQEPADPLVRADATVQVAEHTWVIPDGGVSLVPNVGIVVGTRAVLVIDPGLGRGNGETVLAEVRRLAPEQEIYVASTHHHSEHTTGFLAFPDDARYVSSNVQALEFARSGQQQIESFSRRSPRTAELLADAEVFPPDITFDGEFRLDLGGVRVRFVSVGPTHTTGDTGFFVQEDGVLFSGDVVMRESFLAARQESSMRAWLAAFDTFEALEPGVVVPAHGPLGERALIETNRAVMERIRDRALDLKAEGHDVDEAVTTITAELRADHPGWARANGIAAAVRAAWAEGG
jgi:glyoxylase-like metal-dependent hydrolase (beta-lactamase superfamily II)